MYPQITAMVSSIRGYWIEIGWPQPRQRARSSSHENTGMFSYQASPLPHRGQRDRGCTIDSFGSAPHRRMQTFRKLPMMAPSSAPNATPNGPGSAKSITRDLVKKDSGGNCDVERLHPTREWNGNPPSSRALQGRAHTG